MFTDRDPKDDKESLSQRALRLEERNARAASASAMEDERKEDSRYDSMSSFLIFIVGCSWLTDDMLLL